MFKQINLTEYFFTCSEVLLPSPLIRAYTITSGLPHTTFVFDDQEPVEWLIENNIEYKNESSGKYLRTIKFTNMEDAMAFKLRWQ